MNQEANSINRALLEVQSQLEYLTDQLPEGTYAESLDILNGNSIGKHCRHILEAFENMESGLPNGTVDYENRKRQIIYEVDPDAFIERLAKLIRNLSKAEKSTPLKVRHEPFPDQLDAQEFKSSLGRELLFNMEHMIHHMAIIRLAATHQNLDNCLLPEFGIAFSTLNYQNK
ncbi:MAG: hypothetical protein GC180_00940 [Bacteroidetes bacterium]|nr:hypothetical protein [Bacteroidota bacterium]